MTKEGLNPVISTAGWFGLQPQSSLVPEGRVITNVREMDFPKLPESLFYVMRGDVLSARAVRNKGNKEGSDIVWTWKCNLNQTGKSFMSHGRCCGASGLRYWAKIFKIVICGLIKTTRVGVGSCISLLLIYNDGLFQNNRGVIFYRACLRVCF